MSRPWYRSGIGLAVGIALCLLIVTCSQTNGRGPEAPPDANPIERVLLPAPAFAQAGGGNAAVTVADIAEQAVPSVVNISAEKAPTRQQLPRSPFFNDPYFREFFGDRFNAIPRERKQRSLGSGVIVSKDGIVVTNNHVVEHAEQVEVSLADGRTFDAKLVGTDPKSDVAVLRLEGDVENLRPLPFGDSSSLRLGDVVIAIGNPFGVGQTVTMGIVSATGRGNVGIVDYEDFIQTDAAINPGNSGGALVNMRGELVGINTAILSRSGGYQGIGFAIPSSLAKPIMNKLLADGKVVRGWLGVTIQDLDDDLAKGLDLEVHRGVLISDVGDDTPAKKAGFERGDVIISMNGRPMTSTVKLRNQIALAGPGAKVKFEVVRDGKTKTLSATLGELPAELGGGSTIDLDEGAFGGAQLGELTAQLRRRLDIPDSVDDGVVVTGVESGSRAERAGLREGDVIVELNRRPVKSVSAFRKAYAAAKGTLLLLVQRGSTTLYIAIEK